MSLKTKPRKPIEARTSAAEEMVLPAAERGLPPAVAARFDRLTRRLAQADLKPIKRAEAIAELIEIEQAPKRQREEEEVNRGIGETLALERARGAPVESRPGAPPRRKSGLDWLWDKERISPTQMAAGLRYGDQYRHAHDIVIRSNINNYRSGGDGISVLAKRIEAQQELEGARERLGHPDLIALCDRVCGEGERLRDLSANEADHHRKEGRLTTGLDLLAVHYGMVSR